MYTEVQSLVGFRYHITVYTSLIRSPQIFSEFCHVQLDSVLPEVRVVYFDLASEFDL